MPVKEMVSIEVIERIRGIVALSSFDVGAQNFVWEHYKALGHKYPKHQSCSGCMLSVINYWRAYIREYDNR